MMITFSRKSSEEQWRVLLGDVNVKIIGEPQSGQERL